MRERVCVGKRVRVCSRDPGVYGLAVTRDTTLPTITSIVL